MGILQLLHALFYLTVASYAMLALFLIVGACLPARRQRDKGHDESGEKNRCNNKATIQSASRVA
jgi:hypothetical protein